MNRADDMSRPEMKGNEYGTINTAMERGDVHAISFHPIKFSIVPSSFPGVMAQACQTHSGRPGMTLPVMKRRYCTVPFQVPSFTHLVASRPLTASPRCPSIASSYLGTSTPNSRQKTPCSFNTYIGTYLPVGCQCRETDAGQ